MKLRRVEFRNFKLLDGVVIEFSTDPQKPLTAIRAQNGSGKTSLLWGLAWAFYGHGGLPSKSARLTSTARPSGVPTIVQVIVDFEHDEGSGSYEYVLTRTVEETPGEGDKVSHGPTSTKLLIRKPAGEELVPGDPNVIIESFIPLRLRDVFLTDGDRVQHFISGTVAVKEQQHNVHHAIRAILGMDRLEEAEQDLIAVEREFRKDLAGSGGESLANAEQDLKECEEKHAATEKRHETLHEQRARIEEDRDQVEGQLAEIKGHGDLDAITADLIRTRKALELAREDEGRLFDSIRALFKSDESLSWALAEGPLRQGQKVLSDLYDKRVIPGSSHGVLEDRLQMEQCICGESLAPGTAHREAVEGLLDEQREISAEKEHLTETFHRTRAGLNRFEGARLDGEDFWSVRPHLLQSHTEIVDRQKDVVSRVSGLEKQRALIDQKEVQRLTSRLADATKSHTECSEEIGAIDREITRLEEERALLHHRYEGALAAVKSDVKAQARHDIAKDMQSLVSGTLDTLRSEHVGAVSNRMNEIFMKIVGGAPEMAGAVFQGVHITEKFNIVVGAGNQKTLDTDYEVNGASQRALTLAFIWALMEVSVYVAPRVIDTPLGMTAGGVKRRMVEAITEPVSGEHPDYQVILLLTRSEIRDIEHVLDERAGQFTTLSCSNSYPTELVTDWKVDEPRIRACACNHRQFCEVCERPNDGEYGLVRRSNG